MGGREKGDGNDGVFYSGGGENSTMERCRRRLGDGEGERDDPAVPFFLFMQMPVCREIEPMHQLSCFFLNSVLEVDGFVEGVGGKVLANNNNCK